MAQKEVSVQLTQTSATVEAASSAGATVEQSSSTATVTSSKVDQAQVIMVGPQGPPGPSGAIGASGISGMSGTGPVGPSGATGASGISGMQGEQGVQGIQGDQGEKGDQGDTGPSGATGIGITGATGATGAIGPHITGVSGSGTGVSFLVSGGGILGPINIQGPSGATGISGTSGLKGDTGPQGDAGGTGPTGPQGSQGDQGLVGGDTFNFYFTTDISDTDPGAGYLKFGHSTYSSIDKIYVDDTEKGGDSITDWVGSLDNVYGSRLKVFSSSDAEKWAVFQIVTGNTAKVGYTQINADYVAHSDTFTVDEEISMTFAPAAEGPKGDTGPAGSEGAAGSQGDVGDTGPTGASGIGITGISGSGTGVSFLLSGGGTLGPINIQGPSGATGISGISGMQGEQGVQGIQGAQGDQGDQGDTGPSGATGVSGASVTGATGATGASITGVTGSGTGAYFQLDNGTEIGPINIQGPSGATGISGTKGDTGPQGSQGDQGDQGGQGVQGDQGDQGLVGGDTFNFKWTTDTVVSDPGNGYVKFDNSSYEDVTRVLVDDLEIGGDAISPWVATLDHVTGSRIKIFNASDAEKWAVFRIAEDNTVGAGYTQLNVNYLSHSDAFIADETVCLTYAPAASGAPGGEGPQGPTGVTGDTGYSITGVSGYGTGVYFLTNKPSIIGPLDIQATGATGATGSTGETGSTGQFGGDSQMFYFNSGFAARGGFYHAPGSGYIGFAQSGPINYAEQKTNFDYLRVSGIHVDDTQIDGVDISGWVASFDDDADSSTKGRLRIYSATGSSQFVVYKIIGDIIHHSGDPDQASNNVTGFSIIPVTGIASGMAYTGYTGAFFSGEPIIISYTQVGQRGPTGPQGTAGSDGSDGSDGGGITGATGGGTGTYFQVSGGTEVGPVNIQGPSGATGATGTGDFGGDSFSFHFNSGWNNSTDGPGDRCIKFVSDMNHSQPPYVAAVTGIWISQGNYRDGDVSEWLNSFSNHGSIDNRGVLKIFKRDYVNQNFAGFTITGDIPASSSSSAHYVVGVTRKYSSDTNIVESLGNGCFNHTGETVVTYVPAGPSGGAGQPGEDGDGGGAGAPATGYTGSFQFHAGNLLVRAGGDRLEPGTLSGSTALYEGLEYDPSNDTFWQTTQIGIGEDFSPENGGSDNWQKLTGMSGTLDIRGNTHLSGHFIPHGSGTYDLGYEVSSPGIGTWGDWWNNAWINEIVTKKLTSDSEVIVTGLGANLSVGNYDSDLMIGFDGRMSSPTGYFDTLGAFQDMIGAPPPEAPFHGVFLDSNCMHFSPKVDGGADLGTDSLYWNSLYLNNNSLIMSGVGMTGAVHIGFDNDHNLRISAPKTGNEVTTSGTPVTGYTPSVFADIRLSGGVGDASILKSTNAGEITIATESDEGGETILANSGITTPSGTFISGLSLKSDSLGTYFDVHDDGDSAKLSFCGAVNTCIEDLGEWKFTGYNGGFGYLTAGASNMWVVPMSGSSLKKVNIRYHAPQLKLTGIEAGNSVTIFVDASNPEYSSTDYWRFMSGNNIPFVGIEPNTIEVGKKGLLTITAYGTSESSCVAHWAETDYVP